jgi:hypothetical protein
MESLLIGGAQSVGKSGAIHRLANRLIARGFLPIVSSVPVKFYDFEVVLEGTNRNGKIIRIIINSSTDTPGIIKKFKAFFDKNGTYDILISSIRDDGYWPRREFFKIMGLNPKKNLLEIPLGKITRRNANASIARTWYEDKVDKLIDHVLDNPPYNL